MWIFIEPLDVLFFRDTRPFGAGEIHRAKSLFPPSPYALQGAIRSKILVEQGISFESFRNGKVSQDIKDALGSPEGLGDKFKMKGAFLVDNTLPSPQFYFQAPADVLTGENRLAILQPTNKLPDFSWDISSKGLLPIWTRERGPLSPLQGLLSEKELTYYLTLDNASLMAEKEKTLWASELRVGIGRDKLRGTAEDGKLYMAEFVRLHKGCGFSIEVEGVNGLLPEDGLLSLGGEARCVRYKKTDPINLDSIWEKVKEKLEEKKKDNIYRFKLYLLTPAIFDKEYGWLPNFIDKGSLQGRLGGLQFKLISAAINKPVYIGGWELAKKEGPRPMRKAVPAGSVYFLELLNGGLDELKEIFWFKSILYNDQKGESLTMEGKIGLGISLTGGWDYV